MDNKSLIEQIKFFEEAARKTNDMNLKHIYAEILCRLYEEKK